MNPKELDTLLNGLAVYIHKNPKGNIYATIHDFSRIDPKVTPLKTIRIPLNKLTETWNVDTCPIVAEALAKCRAQS